MDRTRWQGIGLFLFIPLVLILFTRPPGWLGPLPALLCGLAIMLSHRFVAAPWVARHAKRRSLWSGRTLPPGEHGLALRFRGPRGEVEHCTAGEDERRAALCFAAFAVRYRLPLRLAILLPLLLFLLSSLHLGLGGRELFPRQGAWALTLFQGSVALSVVATALLHRWQRPPADFAPIPFPFPLHNLALLGIRNTLLVFAVVGLWWILLSAQRFLELLA